jgi:two-component sensor histidine kinase
MPNPHRPPLRSRRTPKACAIWNTAPHPYVVLSPDLFIVDANEAYSRATLTRRDEVTGQHFFDVFPDNPAAPDVNGVATLRSSFHTVLGQRRSDEVTQIRYDIRGRDGQFVERYWVPITCPVLDDRTGEVMYLLHNPTDATERMKQELLLREAAHRSKNSFATIAAVIRLSAGNPTSEGMADSALKRIAVLERNHHRLGANQWSGCGLKELVKDELAPYSTLTNVCLDGPDVPLNAMAVHSLSMVLHELATNAAKHGAWSNGKGRVLVRWSIEWSDNGTPCLSISWQEENGPSIIRPPGRKGFGSTVICDLLRIEFGARVTMSYAATGLMCRIALPLDRISNHPAPL